MFMKAFKMSLFYRFFFLMFIQIDALPDVVNAARDSTVEIYVDGGIRTGGDVLKALALGARAVFIGRPILWGLTYNVSHIQSDVEKATRHPMKGPQSTSLPIFICNKYFCLFFIFSNIMKRE